MSTPITARRNRRESIAEWMARTEAQYERRMASPHFVYRAFDEFGLLLYIGCTVNVDRRLSAHRSSSQWHRFMAEHTATDPFPDMASARSAEAEAIASEGAYFNGSIDQMRANQANRHAARRMLFDAGIYQPYCDLPVEDICEDNPVWLAHLDEHDAWNALYEELRAELKATTHPYLTDEDRLANYLAAREARAAA